jgi:hypothetical protein
MYDSIVILLRRRSGGLWLMWSDDLQVSIYSTSFHNIMATVLNTTTHQKEVFDAIMQMEKNKAPGPDGFPAKVYQVLWGVVKDDLMRMFSSFQDGNLPLFHLNYGTIILLPKKENAIQIQQYRPICLLNVSFKIFTKVGTNRII